MKTAVRKFMGVIMGIALASFVISCATTGSQAKKSPAAPEKTGILGEYYKNMKPGMEKGDPKLMWIKPGVDFTKYKKVMLDYPVFALADDADYKEIDPNEMKKIGDEASKAFVDALQKEFPLVSDPGPDVLRVRTAIIDLKPSKPVLSAVTTIVPVGLAISLVKKGVEDSWTGSGATTGQLMLIDSVTNQVIACGEDEISAGFSERFSKWGSAEEAFKFWGDRFTKRLVKLTEKK